MDSATCWSPRRGRTDRDVGGTISRSRCFRASGRTQLRVATPQRRPLRARRHAHRRGALLAACCSSIRPHSRASLAHRARGDGVELPDRETRHAERSRVRRRRAARSTGSPAHRTGSAFRQRPALRFAVRSVALHRSRIVWTTASRRRRVDEVPRSKAARKDRRDAPADVSLAGTLASAARCASAARHADGTIDLEATLDGVDLRAVRSVLRATSR